MTIWRETGAWGEETGVWREELPKAVREEELAWCCSV